MDSNRWLWLVWRMSFHGAVEFRRMFLRILFDEIFLFLVLNWMFIWMMTSSLCIFYLLHLSLLTSLLILRKYILSSKMFVMLCCGCIIIVIFFLCFIQNFYCWFLFGIFVNTFDLISLHVYLYFHCRLKYLYWMPFFILPSHIWICLLFVTNLFQYWNFNIFLVFLNWFILFLFDWILIIILYVFLQIC